MNNSKQNVQVSLNFGFPIFLILLILKLTGTVAWSWWIITIPLWLPFAIIGGILGIVALGGLLYILGSTAYDLYKRKK